MPIENTTNDKNQMEFIKSHYYPHFSTEEYCLLVNDHLVYKYYHATKKVEKYFRIPAASTTVSGKIKDFIARSHLARKLSTKIGLGHVIELPSKVVLVIYDKIYRFDPKTNRHVATEVFNLKDSGILPPLRNGIAITPDGNVYFSEYANKTGRDTRLISIKNNGTKLDVCHTFSGSTIKHAHGIYWDKYRSRLWVTTGDNNEQSCFFYSDDEFKTLKKFAGGDQTWRAVSLMIFKEALVWGMDAGKDTSENDLNYIYHCNVNTKERQRVQLINGPAYHITETTEGGFFLGVNYEPGCKQNISAEAAIWYSDNGLTWDKKLTLPYTASPEINGSKYAYIYPPIGVVPKDSYLFTSTNTGKYSGKMYRLLS